MNKSITFRSDNLQLRGNLHLPAENPPCVITLHGLEGDKDRGKWPAIASKLYEEDYACLRFNFRGCGTEKEKSEGVFEDLTLTGRIRDYKSAVNFLQDTGKVDLNRIGVIGSSLGGMVAIAAEVEKVKAIVTLSTPLKIPRYEEPKIPKKVGEYYELPSGRKFKKKFYEDMKEYDLRKSIKRAPPILIIQGDSDEIIPPKHAKILFEHAGEPKGLKIIPSADHAFSNPQHLDKAIDLSLNWFDRYL